MAILVQLSLLAAICSLAIAGVAVPVDLPPKANVTKYISGLHLRAPVPLSTSSAMSTAGSTSHVSTTTTSATTASLTTASATSASATSPSATATTTAASKTKESTTAVTIGAARKTDIPSSSTTPAKTSSRTESTQQKTISPITHLTTSEPTLNKKTPASHTSHLNDIVYQTKLAAKFLEAAAQLSTGLSAKEKRKFGDHELIQMMHDVIENAQSMGEHPLSLRGIHHKRRGVCTVTSRYWDRKCECEFIGADEKQPTHPNWESGHENSNHYPYDRTPISVLTKPSPHKPCRKQECKPTVSSQEISPERKLQGMLQDFDGYLSELKDVLIKLERYSQNSFTQVERSQHEQLLKAPLALVNRLTTMLNSNELFVKLKTRTGRNMELFLEKNMDEVEAMVIHPEYIIGMLGTVGLEQPITNKLQMLIDQLEYLHT